MCSSSDKKTLGPAAPSMEPRTPTHERKRAADPSQQPLLTNHFSAKRVTPSQIGVADGSGLSIKVMARGQGITDVSGDTQNPGIRECLLKPLGFTWEGKGLAVWRYAAPAARRSALAPCAHHQNACAHAGAQCSLRARAQARHRAGKRTSQERRQGVALLP